MDEPTDNYQIMNEEIKKITVFGATGMLGKPVVRELVKADYEVTAMVRDAGRAIPKLPENVNVTEGDLSNREDIAAAIQHADAVYLNLSIRPDVKKYDSFIAERDGLENVLAGVAAVNDDAASTRKIKRVGAISSLVHRYQGTNNFDWWVFEIKKWAAETLIKADVPVSIFYPSSFMETFDQGGIMQGHRLMLPGKSRWPMHFIAGSDYGRMVAEAFRTNDGNDYEYDIHGPQAMTMGEAALEFLKHYRHGPLKITKVPMWPLKLVGMINGEVHYLSRIMEALNNYPEEGPDEQVWQKLGRPRVTLADYARRL
ncbi:SDR family oxidoreductase [Natronogracilivirga saccharolytica]|uniref:NAD(P)H-binding protein n=1 Tax=Natronogracilivirga saccharolytica TaxID=2812953 RepID=A0A8J7RQV0_9BACT|nr:NAD(P)H-binding protein [Natronogracilivirga saccharolytica]MBP3191322.1 NAD(P)H-binding protein [Natronogracilivirga saccharolytica]